MRRTGFVLPLEHPSGTKYVNSPQLQRFLDKKRQVTDSFVSVFLLSRSSRGCKWVPFGAWLSARSTPSTIAPLLLSAKFSAQFELNDFFDFFRLAVSDKNGHDPSTFAKAFEPILRHVLRDKPCDLFLDKLPQNDRTCQRVIKTINM